MANEADSRETTPTLRWGETASEVPDATNVAEPSGGKKDVGWLPGDEGLVGEWLNWCSWAAGVFNRYAEHVFGSWWHVNCVMPDEDAGAGAVTAGVGLSVDVVSARCWLSGARYVVPARTNLALATADATHPRIDLVVARTTGSGVPLFTAITGTTAASPTTPSALAGDASIYSVRVNAGAVVPGTLTDLREFGVVEVDRVVANSRLEAGQTAGDPVLVVAGAPAQTVVINAVSTTMHGDLNVLGSMVVDGPSVAIEAATLNATLTGAMTIETAGVVVIESTGASVNLESAFAVSLTGPIVLVEADATSLNGAVHIDSPEDFAISVITREYDLGALDFTRIGVSVAVTIDPDAQKWTAGIGDEGAIAATARIPNGATITAVRVYGHKTETDSHVDIQFQSHSKSSYTEAFTETADNVGTATGNFVLSITGLNHAVDQNEIYKLRLGLHGVSGAVDVWAATIVYTLTRPFASV